jgi:predicted ribosome quality control (RQC) complex YloA/Tae2 family protein
MEIRVGKNAKDNFRLIDASEAEWLWFHVDDSPSAHVVLCALDVTPDLIRQAAATCAMHSKCRTQKKVKIVYCPISNIRKEKTIGMVSFADPRECRYITIAPREWISTS